MKTLAVTIFFGLGATAGANGDQPKAKPVEKLPVTTSSEEARALYVKAQDFADKLRGTDAYDTFAKAVAKDKDFAMAYLGMANNAGTNPEFFDALGHAVATAGKASPGEKLLIASAEAGSKNDLTHQKEAIDKLVKMFPTDERIQNQLGQYLFARQDYAASIAAYEKAIAINPGFSQPYNQLGYAYRFSAKPADAERTFKKYIELIPNDPNPYDSYAELLMEEGKFDDSIASYQKALKLDPTFVASYIGIGNDQMFQGHTEEARKTFDKLVKAARNDGERRQAITWTALAYSADGQWDKALAEADKLVAIANANKSLAMLANDYNFIANTLLEAGRVDEAAAKFKLQVETSDESELPAGVKELTRRGELYDEARIAIAKHDLATAKTKSALYSKQVAGKGNPFELRQQHELAGMVAIEDKKFSVAVDELAHANQRDPRVLYLQAVALHGMKDETRAKQMAAKAADFNGLAFNYVYVRAKAQALK